VYLTYVLALLAGLLGLGSAVVRQRVGTPAFLLITVLGAGIVANALVTGALANVLDRLQARTAWLLPFVVLVLAVECFLALREGRQGATTSPPVIPD
jgi:hypothetical protein